MNDADYLALGRKCREWLKSNTDEPRTAVELMIDTLADYVAEGPPNALAEVTRLLTEGVAARKEYDRRRGSA